MSKPPFLILPLARTSVFSLQLNYKKNQAKRSLLFCLVLA
ncbi:hypothetical protein NT04LM_4452 [Listeria monocytogenes FSL F2-208]|nr:hypothetical protein NT04LM_4452 [Listeria monocytogenes FSL F2-208]